MALGMTGVNGSFYSGVETTEYVDGQRKAVKVSSPVTYNVGTLLLADVAHAPDVCGKLGQQGEGFSTRRSLLSTFNFFCSGVWPALWMVSNSATWPEGGEVSPRLFPASCEAQ